MSKNLWGNLTSIKGDSNPLDILKEQSGYLLDATDNIIYTDLQTDEGILAEYDFYTVFSIKSKFMDRYEFEVFSLHYDVTFFPVLVDLDENISNELSLKSDFEIKNNEDFYSFLEKVLGCNHTKKVIASLYSMSK